MAESKLQCTVPSKWHEACEENGPTLGWVIALWPGRDWGAYSFKRPDFQSIRVHGDLGFAGLTLHEVSGGLDWYSAPIYSRGWISISESPFCSGPVSAEALPPIYSTTMLSLNPSLLAQHVVPQFLNRHLGTTLHSFFALNFLIQSISKCCPFHLLNMFQLWMHLSSSPKPPVQAPNIYPNWSLCFPSCLFHTQSPNSSQKELLKRKWFSVAWKPSLFPWLDQPFIVWLMPSMPTTSPLLSCSSSTV